MLAVSSSVKFDHRIKSIPVSQLIRGFIFHARLRREPVTCLSANKVITGHLVPSKIRSGYLANKSMAWPLFSTIVKQSRSRWIKSKPFYHNPALSHGKPFSTHRFGHLKCSRSLEALVQSHTVKSEHTKRTFLSEVAPQVRHLLDLFQIGRRHIKNELIVIKCALVIENCL